MTRFLQHLTTWFAVVRGMTLQDWGNLGSAVGGIATFAGVVLAIYGVRRWRWEQRETKRSDAAGTLLAAHTQFCDMAAYVAKIVAKRAELPETGSGGDAAAVLKNTLGGCNEQIRAAVSALSDARARTAAYLTVVELKATEEAEHRWGAFLMRFAAACDAIERGTAPGRYAPSFHSFSSLAVYIRDKGMLELGRIARHERGPGFVRRAWVRWRIHRRVERWSRKTADEQRSDKAR